MQISLLDEEVELLQIALPNLRGGKTWVKDSIIKKLAAGLADREERRLCPHKEATFEGKKTCCGTCMSYFKPGQGETWQRVRIEPEVTLVTERKQDGTSTIQNKD